MSDPVIVILVSVGLGLIAAVWALLMWNSRHSARYVARAVGIILLIIGAYLTGVSGLVLQWVRGLVDWVQRKELDTATWIGIAVAVLGLIAYLGGGLIKAPTREEARQRQLAQETERQERLAEQAAKVRQQSKPQPAPRPQQPPPLPSQSQPPTGQPTTKAPGATPASADDEVSNILKKHGLE